MRRGEEIKAWIDESNFSGNFVIVDDEADMGDLIDHLVRTSYNGAMGSTGLTVAHTKRIIARLNRAEINWNCYPEHLRPLKA